MEKVKLNELADIYLGVTHTPEYVFEGVPFLSVKDISGGKIYFDDCKYISKEEYDSLSEGAKPKVGDMLFCRVGTLGKPIIIPEGTPLFGSFVSLGYLRNRNSDRCDLNYLRYWMYSNSFWKQVNANVKGASQVNLNTGWLSKFDIDLPGIAEQRYRISVLDKCKSVIEKREAELAALDDLIKARFVEMFGDIATGNYKYDTRKLGDVANVGSSHRVFTTEFVKKGIPFYRGTEIGELANGNKPAEPFYISEEHYNRLVYNDTKPQVGDLLLPSICNKGQVWMVDTDEPFYYKDGRVLCISPDREIFDTKYLEYFMKVKTLVEYPKLGSGSTFAEFKIFLLKNIDVLIPPRELQGQFSMFVNQVDKSKVAVRKALEETQLLFDSLMQQYFG